LQLLEKAGVTVDYPSGQTCCGQPLANAGFEGYAKDGGLHFIEVFKKYDYVVAPSGSCVFHVREHFDLLEQTEDVRHVRDNTFELCEFLVKVLQIEDFNASFPHRVGLHLGCHGLRGLRLGKSSELIGESYSIPLQLLEKVKGIDLIDLSRPDECCGFGGSFAITEEALSVKMGKDRLKDHQSNGAEVITSADMSCLMHLEGVARKRELPIKFLHISEILTHS